MKKQPKLEIERPFAKILPEIRSLIEVSRHHAAFTANLALVNLYWNIGRIITEDIQKNEKRAGYGEQLIEVLAVELGKEYGRGYSVSNLNDMRRFYEGFRILQTLSVESSETNIRQPLANKLSDLEALPPLAAESLAQPISQTAFNKFRSGKILQTVSVESSKPRIRQAVPAESQDRILIDLGQDFWLGWSHYRRLLSQGDPLKRRFYFEQTATQRWSVRELQRQIEGALFERVALSRNTRKLAALEKKKGPPETVHYEDIFKDPYLLDFLGLKGAYSEKDLEAAIIRNLEQFLRELGSDFCFIGRQYPMRIDDVDYFLDLLFFHRGLRCLVAIDLKLGTFSASDKGQMDLYLAWLKEHEWRSGENEPLGLILCSSKKRQHVELLLRHGPHKMQVSEYLIKLPSKEMFEERLKLYSRLLDQYPDDEKRV
jgi:predicted nuclease of restriction endonuclease-like (RecB) superfamily